MNLIPTVLLTILLASGLVPPESAWARSGQEVKPLYTLSDFSGRVPYDIVRLAIDQATDEILVLNPRDGDIRVFNTTGMEVFRTESYQSIGQPVDLAVAGDGDIDLLVRTGSGHKVFICNYRGEPVSELPLAGIPDGFTDMRAERILRNNGHLFLVDMGSLRVAVFDANGHYARGYKIAEILGLDRKEIDESTMFGIAVDSEDNLYFTMPVRFSVYRITPDGHASRFGEPGSAPGKFSVVSGVAVDGQGNIYLSDRRRSVVMVYSPGFQFRYEFGYRGSGPGNLIVPGDLALDQNGKLYVTQMRKRGIRVFRVLPPDIRGNQQ